MDSKYLYLMTKAEECLDKAKECLAKGETDLCNFYNNAYHGFVVKAHNFEQECLDE